MGGSIPNAAQVMHKRPGFQPGKTLASGLASQAFQDPAMKKDGPKPVPPLY